MRNTIKKKITKGFLLFLFTFFSVGVQAQWDEYGGGGQASGYNSPYYLGNGFFLDMDFYAPYFNYYGGSNGDSNGDSNGGSNFDYNYSTNSTGSLADYVWGINGPTGGYNSAYGWVEDYQVDPDVYAHYLANSVGSSNNIINDYSNYPDGFFNYVVGGVVTNSGVSYGGGLPAYTITRIYEGITTTYRGTYFDYECNCYAPMIVATRNYSYTITYNSNSLSNVSGGGYTTSSNSGSTTSTSGSPTIPPPTIPPPCANRIACAGVIVNCVCVEKPDPCLNKDLRHKIVSDNVKNLIDQRKKTVFINGSYVDVKEFEIQKIEDGWGDINLDKYALNITSLPSGYTPQMLFEEIRKNFDDFVTGGNLLVTSVGLEPYSTADGTKWNSSNPIGAAMDFDNFMDTSTVICTEYDYNKMNWTFTTVHSLDHLGHFVSGHRQFGIETNSDGSYSFYLRGADRLGQFVDFATNGFNSGADYLFNEAADATWKNCMSNLEKFIKSKTGAAVKPFDKNKDYANRFPYNESDCPQ